MQCYVHGGAVAMGEVRLQGVAVEEWEVGIQVENPCAGVLCCKLFGHPLAASFDFGTDVVVVKPTVINYMVGLQVWVTKNGQRHSPTLPFRQRRYNENIQQKIEDKKGECA